MDRNGSPNRARQALDAVVYAVAVSAVVFCLGAAVSLVLGGGWLVIEYVMFLVGLLMFGYATFLLRPAPPWDTEQTEEGKVKVTRNDSERGTVIDDREETRFQAFVQRIPPLPQYPLPPSERLPIGVKMFLASIVVLATSFGIERLFIV